MGEISNEEAEKLWASTLVHDDGVIGTGGEFLQLVGPFGRGKSTLIMQIAQWVRHLEYGKTKEGFDKNPGKYKVYPETVVMRGLQYDHWNVLLPENWESSFPTWGKAKPICVFTHYNDSIKFREISQGKHRGVKANGKYLTSKKYTDARDLVGKLKKGAINIIYEPQNYKLSPHLITRLKAMKFQEAPEKEKKSEGIEVPPGIFWYEFIDVLSSMKAGQFITIIIDEFHTLCQDNPSGDLYHLQKWFAHVIIHLRKLNISLIYSTHDTNLIDYRVVDRMSKTVWFKGATPRKSTVFQTALSNLPDKGQAIIEMRGVSFGKFPFHRIHKQPPVLQAVGVSAF